MGLNGLNEVYLFFEKLVAISPNFDLKLAEALAIVLMRFCGNLGLSECDIL